jgi:hypothetical protein
MLSLAASFRLLPRFLAFTRILVRGILILSYRLYRLILLQLDGAIFQHLGVDLFTGLTRVVACILLSLFGGLLIAMLFELFDIIGWVIGVATIHGLVVSLTWDELEEPGGIQVGRRIE